MKKVLVVYYSLDGATEMIAQKLALTLEADISAIKPLKDFNPKGFIKYIMGGYQVMRKQKPELAPLNFDFNKYDLIFIGTPVWAGSFTPAIRTLIDSNLITNKKVYLFFTHGGGNNHVLEDAKKIIEKNNSFGGGLGFLSVKKNPGNRINAAQQWATSIIDEEYKK
jgi:flavodoxin